jgi:hypothetical protein
VPLPDPVPGLIVSYASGPGGGRQGPALRRRPGCPPRGRQRLATAEPITHAPPRHPEKAIELPAATKRRLGLYDAQSWIVATEMNRFSGRDCALFQASRAAFAYGTLPRQLMLKLRDRFAELHRDQRFRMVSRETDDNGHSR